MTYTEYRAMRDRVYELIDEVLAKGQQERLDGAAWLQPLIVTLTSTLIAMQRCGSPVTLESLLEAVKEHYDAAVMFTLAPEELKESVAKPVERTLH